MGPDQARGADFPPEAWKDLRRGFPQDANVDHLLTKFDRGGGRVEKKKKERAGLVGSLIHTDVTGEKSAPGSVMLTSGYFPPPPSTIREREIQADQ